MKDDPDRGMLCIDWDDDDPIEIYKTESDNDYQRLEIFLLPCNYLNSEFGNVDSVKPECVTDLEEQIKYLGPIHWQLYVN